MAMLWCFFLIAQHYFRLSSNKRYLLAVHSIVFGFVWFIYTLLSYYISGTGNLIGVRLNILESFSLLPSILTAASIAYLCLLIVPAYKIIRNWRFLQTLRKKGLEKISFRHRIFVQNIAAHLGIKKPVKVYISRLITSPVTIGFLKPVILIPIAALNNLSLVQIEAVLLHELSHIRRHDYLINLMLVIIHMLLYFNPFVKFFIKRLEIERENCCDEMVLQFEYDRISYASALLQLEKNSQTIQMAMAIADKNYLLHRIQKIVGMQKKPSFKTSHFAGGFAGLLLLLVINSLIITGRQKIKGLPYNDYSQTYSFFVNENKELSTPANKKIYPSYKKAGVLVQTLPSKKSKTQKPKENIFYPSGEHASSLTPSLPFINASFTESQDAVVLNSQENKQVTRTVVATKKVLETRWKDVEESIGDGMSALEKDLAKRQYLTEVESVDWQKLEQKLKGSYNKIDWKKLDRDIAESLVAAEYDSIATTYTKVIKELNKINSSVCQTQQLALPDVSEKELKKVKMEIESKIDSIKSLRSKKVIRL
jgi:beta-lactamase regulating signal transducer with metallopeptidase domain